MTGASDITHGNDRETQNEPSTPATRTPRAFSTKYSLAYLGSCIAWAAPGQILLGMQMIELRPDSKETALATLMMLGGAAQVLASLVTGTLADRSALSLRSTWSRRWGRRIPWVIIGAISCAIALIAMSLSPSYWVLVCLWCTFQVFMAFVTNNLLTVTVDNYPQQRYGVISGLLGAAYTAGLVMGTVVATVFPVATSYVVISVLMLLLIGQFLVGRGRVDHSAISHDAELQALGADAQLMLADSADVDDARRLVATYRDYWLVFASRFVIHLANYASLFYLLYYLRDHIGHDDPETGVLVLTVIYAAFTIATAYVGGKMSDRLARRKIFVSLSVVGIVAATLMMTVTHDFAVVVVAACVLGSAWGVFTAVDQAMINEALPSKTNRARDISVMTLTVGISNMLSGGFAAVALNYLGGYSGLYLLCGVTCAAGLFFIVPVKSSR